MHTARPRQKPDTKIPDLPEGNGSLPEGVAKTDVAKALGLMITNQDEQNHAEHRRKKT